MEICKLQPSKVFLTATPVGKDAAELEVVIFEDAVRPIKFLDSKVFRAGSRILNFEVGKSLKANERNGVRVN